MNSRKHVSTVRFEPLPPATPQEWRRRVEAAHDYAPLSQLALHVAFAAATTSGELNAYPMSRRMFAQIRGEFGPIGLPIPTQDEVCRAVCELHARRLAAPWWRVTPAQLARYGTEGR